MNAFDSLAEMAAVKVPVVILHGRSVGPDGRPADLPDDKKKALRVMIHMITPNQLLEADSMLDQAKPPPQTEEKPGERFGTVKVQTGYDYDDPGYVAERHKLLPMRNAVLVLHGCDEIRDSTPGDSVLAKARKLNDSIPFDVLDYLASRIEGLAAMTLAGEQDVEAFFREGSGNSPDSGSSNKQSRTRKSRKSSESSTAATSTTASEKPPASGA